MDRATFLLLLLVSFSANSVVNAALQSYDMHAAITEEKISVIAAKIPEARKAQIQKMLTKIMPDLIIEEITVAPLPGIYQIIANSDVFYVSEDGKYLLHGNLFDLTKDKESLNQTEEIRKKIRLKLLATIASDEMIVFTPTVVKNIVTIFTDIDCTFCRQLHKEIGKIQELGIEIRYVAFPRQGINSASYQKTESVWCAADRNAMLTVAKNGGEVPSKNCATSIAKQYEVGRKLGINGTPTVVFADGFMLASYMPAEQLAILAEKHQASDKLTK